ncbi:MULTISPECIES: lipopolysaccharide biosynthesis protein [Paenibacillus]|uniref:lipopolysaccharide biosynthesis protein n=1 Tax=Paenibacillus TaxID=44249 RepID=UPI0022B91710|nr:oligosaccharide flippase family protein [Paenibacillus caseinilyticus]MCZ8519303.1 oligosaccharide flippase family protein [Paenibacillus caseinilyticus]
MANPKYRRLVTDLFLYGLGTLGSKLIVFLLLPLYTRTLSTEDYGFIELVNTITVIAVPLIGLQISDALYRHLLDLQDRLEEKTRYITTGLALATCGALLSILVYLAWKSAFGASHLLQNRDGLILLLVLASLAAAFCKQVIRGLGNTKAFVLSDVVTTAGTAAGAVYFLAVERLGIDGFLYSLLLSQTAALLLLIFWGRLWKQLSPSAVRWTYAKQLLSYSIPLLPNLMAWWVIQAVDRYLIYAFEGAGEVGLYAVGMKLASIVALMTTVFHMAWQPGAIQMYAEPQKDRLFSDVFQTYYVMLCTGIAVLLLLLKPLLVVMAAPDYYTSWKYASVLLAGSFFVGLSSFYGITYMITKQTKGAFLSSVIGAAASIGLNLLLIPAIGSMGAAWANMGAFVIMWGVRILHTRTYLDIQMQPRLLGGNVALLLLLAVTHFLPSPEVFASGLRLVLMTCMLLLNRSRLKRLYRLLLGLRQKEAG